MILVIDNFDSFTYNLVDYFKQLGQTVEVRRNNLPFEELIINDCDGVVLSPGPGTPENAGQLMDVIEYYAGAKPILGICLGHQAIGQYFGATLKKAFKPMHGKISEVVHEPDELFRNIPGRFSVVRYHSLVCDQLPENLNTIAKTDDGEIMSFVHADLPIYGLQFHPEAVLTAFGLEIFENWTNLITPSD